MVVRFAVDLFKISRMIERIQKLLDKKMKTTCEKYLTLKLMVFIFEKNSGCRISDSDLERLFDG